MLVRTSSLAAMLRAVFTSLESERACHITLNGWVRPQTAYDLDRAGREGGNDH